MLHVPLRLGIENTFLYKISKFGGTTSLIKLFLNEMIPKKMMKNVVFAKIKVAYSNLVSS